MVVIVVDAVAVVGAVVHQAVLSKAPIDFPRAQVGPSVVCRLSSLLSYSTGPPTTNAYSDQNLVVTPILSVSISIQTANGNKSQ